MSTDGGEKWPMYPHCRLAAPHEHETLNNAARRSLLLVEYRHADAPRDLSREEFAAVLPPRAPAGCLQNIERGRVARELARLGFTVAGERPAAREKKKRAKPSTKTRARRGRAT